MNDIIPIGVFHTVILCSLNRNYSSVKPCETLIEIRRQLNDSWNIFVAARYNPLGPWEEIRELCMDGIADEITAIKELSETVSGILSGRARHATGKPSVAKED